VDSILNQKLNMLMTIIGVLIAVLVIKKQFKEKSQNILVVDMMMPLEVDCCN